MMAGTPATRSTSNAALRRALEDLRRHLDLHADCTPGACAARSTLIFRVQLALRDEEAAAARELGR